MAQMVPTTGFGAAAVMGQRVFQQCEQRIGCQRAAEQFGHMAQEPPWRGQL